jgi:hypothetical protein
VTIEVGDETITVRATKLTGAERGPSSAISRPKIS